MALSGKPLVWSPRGASDTLDSSTAFSGAMASLQNLIPDPSTKDLWQCRPAGTQLINFSASGFSSGFSTGFGIPFNLATFISCYMVIGTRIYGMVSTARNAGKDEPFVFDIPSATFIFPTGVTNANTPISPAQIGTWNPPTMALVGAKIIVTHSGFTGAGGAFFGVLDISNPATPTWTAANTTVNPLPAVPAWVEAFNGRAFFLVNPLNGQPGAYMSDALNPTVVTNANQVLTFGDNQPLTCAGGLALQNQLGGVIQALMIFKDVTNIYQVTGDYALNNLSINTLNVATGTFAPNTVQSTSKGLAFVAPDGLRLIDFGATVSDPIGKAGDGITAPFFFSLVPSRMCACYNGGVYRVQVQNGQAVGSPQQQWWYDFVREVWSGPHTQAASLMAAYINTFIVTLQGAGAKLFTSDQVQSTTSTYTENGVALTFNWSTPMLPDIDTMSEIEMIEATLSMALVSGNPVVVSAFDQDSTVFDAVTVIATGQATTWGVFVWGQALWQGAKNALFPRRLSWHFPIVFRRIGIAANGMSAAGVKIGRLHMRYNPLGYLQSGG